MTVGADPMTGKQRQRSITGKTQQEVAQKLRQLTTEIDNRTYREPSKMTVGEWLDTWQEQYLDDLKDVRDRCPYPSETRLGDEEIRCLVAG